MKSGKLVPDNMMLRLILSEFSSRGWISSGPVLPYSLSMTSTSTTEMNVSDSMSDVAAFPDHQQYSYSNSPAASFILDGFPRNLSQATQIDKLVPINLVVQISTPASIIIDRIANRWIHAPSGRVYNTTFNPPKTPGFDDITGEPLTKRSDDDPEVWKARLAHFERTSQPLLEHYESRDLLWKVEGNSSNEISPKLFAEFERRFL
jgi:adenylate kinase